MPDTRIQIDTSQLSCPYFTVPEAGAAVVDGSASPPPTVALPAATECHFHVCSADGSNRSPADFAFTVAADGSVDYSPAFDHFLAGRGSHCLTVQGIRVQLDVRLHHWLQLRLTQNRFEAHSQGVLCLPPCTTYRLDGPAGGFDFGLSADGTVMLEPDAVFAEAGPNQLTVRGFTITIDQSRLDHQLLPGGPNGSFFGFITGGTRDLAVIPADGYGFQPGSGVVTDWSFCVSSDGHLTLDPRFTEFVTIGGPEGKTLIVRGHTVYIDCRNLKQDLRPLAPASEPRLIPSGEVTPYTAIPAHNYGLATDSCVVNMMFDITEEGQVAVNPAYSGFAHVDGDLRNTLVLRSHMVYIDCTALPHDLQLQSHPHPLFRRAAITPFAVVPARGYGFHAGSGVNADVTFDVTPEGTVALNPAYRGFARGRGNTLTLRPYTVRVDGTALSHDLQLVNFFGLEVPMSRHRVNSVTAIPADCRAGYALGSISSGAPSSVTFGITPDGQVSLAPTQSGCASAEGKTLVLHGYPVLLDATQADSDLVGIWNLLKQPDDPGTTRLGAREILAVLVPSGIPGTPQNGYLPETANGRFAESMGFELLVDGTITSQSPTPGGYVVTLSASPNPSAAGQEVTFAACVRPAPPGGGTPQGTLSVADGATVLGSAPLDRHGRASLSTASLAAGDHEITLTYSGDTNFEPGSATVRHHVN
ncbi:Ig-like domain-containing protein [Streptomyces griseosporeus]|uniref:Ig-like domain-containing protein n=1 Tax=Streptomyces griseosporeus TaxID=1910 RepID=UPI00167CAE01|nr:Ig-like domain-containing protein [Streptomyces griseosporeus]GHF36289.1 hypothetical protein GCM10018783_00720 [Streptomyces griseosporeus]